MQFWATSCMEATPPCKLSATSVHGGGVAVRVSAASAQGRAASVQLSPGSVHGRLRVELPLSRQIEEVPLLGAPEVLGRPKRDRPRERRLHPRRGVGLGVRVEKEAREGEVHVELRRVHRARRAHGRREELRRHSLAEAVEERISLVVDAEGRSGG